MGCRLFVDWSVRSVQCRRRFGKLGRSYANELVDIVHKNH